MAAQCRVEVDASATIVNSLGTRRYASAKLLNNGARIDVAWTYGTTCHLWGGPMMWFFCKIVVHWSEGLCCELSKGPWLKSSKRALRHYMSTTARDRCSTQTETETVTWNRLSSSRSTNHVSRNLVDQPITIAEIWQIGKRWCMLMYDE